MLAYEILLTLLDEAGRRAVMRHFADIAEPIVDVQEIASNFTGLVDSITGCQVEEAKLIVPVSLAGGVKTSPAANSDVQERGLFTWRTVNGFASQVGVPGFLESKIDNINAVVDLTDADVIAYNDAIINGLDTALANTVAFHDLRGEDIVSLESAIEIFRSRSRR